MVFILLGVLIILYSLLDFKKAYYIFLVYQIFWMRLTVLIDIDGLPTITLEMLMSAWFLFLFLLKRKKYIRTKLNMPFQTPIVLIILSMFITCFTGVAGFNYEFSRMISIAVTNFSNIWITWYLVETEQEFNKLIKWYMYVFLAAAIFGLVEYVLKYNILVEYKSDLSVNGISIYSLIDGDKYRSRGYRLMSVFEHCIGAGMTFGLFSVFAMNLYIFKKKVSKRWLLLATALICIVCMFLTKMRSAYLFLIIGLLSCVDFKKKRFLKVLLLVIIGVAILYPIWDDYLYLAMSFFNQNAQIKTGGSSMEMRLTQLAAVIAIASQSPIGGMGEKFSQYIANQYTLMALDYESLWFEQIAKHGICGVLAYISYIVYSVFYIPRKFECKTVMWIFIGLWLTYTLSSVPSFRWSFLYFVVFYFIKQTPRYKELSGRKY